MQKLFPGFRYLDWRNGIVIIAAVPGDSFSSAVYIHIHICIYIVASYEMFDVIRTRTSFLLLSLGQQTARPRLARRVFVNPRAIFHFLPSGPIDIQSKVKEQAERKRER